MFANSNNKHQEWKWDIGRIDSFSFTTILLSMRGAQNAPISAKKPDIYQNSHFAYLGPSLKTLDWPSDEEIVRTYMSYLVTQDQQKLIQARSITNNERNQLRLVFVEFCVAEGVVDLGVQKAPWYADLKPDAEQRRVELAKAWQPRRPVTQELVEHARSLLEELRSLARKVAEGILQQLLSNPSIRHAIRATNDQLTETERRQTKVIALGERRAKAAIRQARTELDSTS